MVKQEVPVMGDKRYGEVRGKQRPIKTMRHTDPALTPAVRSPFAVQDVLDAGLGDDGVVAFEPLVLVLANEGGVMAAL